VTVFILNLTLWNSVNPARNYIVQLNETVCRMI